MTQTKPNRKDIKKWLKYFQVAGWLNKKGQSVLIEMLLNPDKRDIDDDISKEMQITKHDIERNKKARLRDREKIKPPPKMTGK